MLVKSLLSASLMLLGATAVPVQAADQVGWWSTFSWRGITNGYSDGEGTEFYISCDPEGDLFGATMGVAVAGYRPVELIVRFLVDGEAFELEGSDDGEFGPPGRAQVDNLEVLFTHLRKGNHLVLQLSSESMYQADEPNILQQVEIPLTGSSKALTRTPCG